MSLSHMWETIESLVKITRTAEVALDEGRDSGPLPGRTV